MSWTVHEDVYATAAPNVEDILKQVVDDDDDEGGRVHAAGKYTKSSQVFGSATTSAASHRDVAHPHALDHHPRNTHQQQQLQQQPSPALLSMHHTRYAHTAQAHHRLNTAALLPSSSSSSSMHEAASLRAWLPPPPPSSSSSSLHSASVALTPSHHAPCATSTLDDTLSCHYRRGDCGGILTSSSSSSHAGHLTYTEQHALYSPNGTYTSLPLHEQTYTCHTMGDTEDYTDKRTSRRPGAYQRARASADVGTDALTCTSLPPSAAAATSATHDARLLLGATCDDEWLGIAFGNGHAHAYAHHRQQAPPPPPPPSSQQQQQQQQQQHQAHSAELTAAAAAAAAVASAVLVPLDTLRGKVYETAKDQHGCRYLQRWLDANGDADAVRAVVQEIVPHIAELMTDQYANFLVQKLFDVMPDDVRYLVARTAAPQMVQIALTPHGTFSVQKMVETITSVAEMQLVRDALAPDVIMLIKDAHGNHVIQKILQRFGSADKEFIYEAVAHDCAAVARDKQGCCVLQRCLEYASSPQRDVLVQRILSCCLQLVQDPFGNYVLQYVLQTNDSTINDTIAIAFLPHLVQLCMNKFSSNVMEKVLRGASPPIQEMYVEAMCNADVVACLVQDDYGNYVLQTALSLRYTPQTEALVAAIRPLMPLVKNAPYAKKLESKMDTVVRKSMSSAGVGTSSGSASFDAVTYRHHLGTADTMQRARPAGARSGRVNHAYTRYDRMRADMYSTTWDSQ